MARIPPEQLPQPIYPGQPGQPGQPGPPGRPGIQPAPQPGVPHAAAEFDSGPPRKRPPTALIAGIVGAAVVVIAIVVVLVLVLGGEEKPPATSSAASSSAPVGQGAGGSAGGSSQAKTAANLMVGQVSMPPGEYQCVVDAFDQDTALADAVVAGNAEATEAADLLVSCVSSGTVADAVTKGLAGQYPPASIECFRSNVASMDEGTLAQLLTAVISGDTQSAQTILSYAATGC